jgi:hypothetical protein
MRTVSATRWTAAGFTVLFGFLAGCSKPASPPAQTESAANQPAATERAPDAVSQASPATGGAAPAQAGGQELPVRVIPNIPESAEAYYAPDSFHIIAQTKDPDAAQPEKGKVGGSLTLPTRTPARS